MSSSLFSTDLFLFFLFSLGPNRQRSVQEKFQFFTEFLIFHHDPFITTEIFFDGVAVLDRVPELVISVETFANLSFGRSVHIGDLIAGIYLLQVNCHHFGLAQIGYQLFEEYLITVSSEGLAVFVLIPLGLVRSIDEVMGDG